MAMIVREVRRLSSEVEIGGVSYPMPGCSGPVLMTWLRIPGSAALILVSIQQLDEVA